METRQISVNQIKSSITKINQNSLILNINNNKVYITRKLFNKILNMDTVTYIISKSDQGLDWMEVIMPTRW